MQVTCDEEHGKQHFRKGTITQYVEKDACASAPKQNSYIYFCWHYCAAVVLCDVYLKHCYLVDINLIPVTQI